MIKGAVLIGWHAGREGWEMDKRNDASLAALIEAAKDARPAVMARIVAFAREVVQADMTGNVDLQADTQAWLDASTSDVLASLDELEADVPRAERERWLSAMWDEATPVRFDDATGELVEVEG